MTSRDPDFPSLLGAPRNLTPTTRSPRLGSQIVSAAMDGPRVRRHTARRRLVTVWESTEGVEGEAVMRERAYAALNQIPCSPRCVRSSAPVPASQLPRPQVSRLSHPLPSAWTVGGCDSTSEPQPQALMELVVPEDSSRMHCRDWLAQGGPPKGQTTGTSLLAGGDKRTPAHLTTQSRRLSPGVLGAGYGYGVVRLNSST